MQIQKRNLHLQFIKKEMTMSAKLYCCKNYKFFCKKCECKVCKDLLPICKCFVKTLNFDWFVVGYIGEDLEQEN